MFRNFLTLVLSFIYLRCYFVGSPENGECNANIVNVIICFVGVTLIMVIVFSLCVFLSSSEMLLKIDVSDSCLVGMKEGK